jgi:hypothetical protein
VVRPFLEPDEQVRQVILAQSGIHPMLAPSIGLLFLSSCSSSSGG